MNISILDLEWYNNNNLMPNIQCMKLSSYYKQKGCNINFIKNEYEFKYQYDKMFIFKEHEQTPVPDNFYISSPNIFYIGKGFRYRNKTLLNEVIMSCRPDYLLYPTTSSMSCVQCFYKNTPLYHMQDFHNTLKDRKVRRTYVYDKDFWKQKKEDILYCCNWLKKERSITFLYPISLKRIIEDIDIQNAFFSLRFSKGTEFKWKNDLGQDITSAEKIINFIEQLKTHTTSKIDFIPFKARIESDMNYAFDLYRLFSIITLFKQHKIQCRIINNRPKEYNSWMFIILEQWTKTYIKLSFIEYILHFFCLSSGIVWYDILNDSIYWKDDKIRFLLQIIYQQNFQDFIVAQWGSNVLDINKIDMDYINEKINLMDREL